MTTETKSSCNEVPLRMEGAITETDRGAVYSERLARYIPKAILYSRRTLSTLVDSGAPADVLSQMTAVLGLLEAVRQRAELYVGKVQQDTANEERLRAAEKLSADLEKEVAALKNEVQAAVTHGSKVNIEPLNPDEPQPAKCSLCGGICHKTSNGGVLPHDCKGLEGTEENHADSTQEVGSDHPSGR
jgi:hypothetical protein